MLYLPVQFFNPQMGTFNYYVITNDQNLDPPPPHVRTYFILVNPPSANVYKFSSTPTQPLQKQ